MVNHFSIAKRLAVLGIAAALISVGVYPLAASAGYNAYDVTYYNEQNLPPTNITEWVIVDAAKNTTANPAKTRQKYTGTVEVWVEGRIQSSGTSISDSFYIYTDYDRQPVQPFPAREFGLYANGNRVADSSQFNQQGKNAYRFVVNLGNTPQEIAFSIGDRYLVDNKGTFRLGVRGTVGSEKPREQPKPSKPVVQNPPRECYQGSHNRSRLWIRNAPENKDANCSYPNWGDLSALRNIR